MDPGQKEIAEHVVQNIETVVGLHARAEARVDRHQRLVERVTRWLGRPRTVYLIVLGVIAWVMLNVSLPRAIDPPPFVWLQGVVSLSALLMTTMVLTTQNRHERDALRREHLDLQVNLLAEQKATKAIELLEKLRRDLPIPNHDDAVAQAMSEAVDPDAVVSAVERELDARDHE